MEVTKIQTLIEDFLGYEVVHVSSEIPFIAVVQVKQKYVYVTDMLLDLFEHAERLGILAHEIGHIELNHSEGKSSLLQELEADIYAAKKVGIVPISCALKRTIAISKLRYKQGISSLQKYQRQQSEYSKRLGNLIDFSSGKETVLNYAKNLS